MEQINAAHQDDFTAPLMIFPISNHSLGIRATSSMDRCIDKCEKAIKEHSIRVKPEKKPARNASQKDKDFYAQEEFNPVMGSVFLLMAKAQFHKAEFMSANATCAYIVRHFAFDKTLCDEARILMARSYYESDWMYEAENIFHKMNQDGFDASLGSDYALAYADFLMKREEYSQAIPYLEMAIHPTMPRKDRQRYTYLLAQLYQLEQNNKKADALYKSVLRMNPPYAMDLNARIAQTELGVQENPRKALRKLRRMSRNPNNEQHLDAIYYAMANIYFNTGDTLQAVEHYRKVIEQTADNTVFKRDALSHLGDFYYRQDSFLQAAPLYQDLASMVDETYNDYQLVQDRSEVLTALEPQLQTIFDQDSLLYLASLPQEELQAMVDAWVEEAVKKAKEEARLKGQQEALAANEEMTQESLNDRQQNTIAAADMGLSNTDNSWYFYNKSAKDKGKKDFERSWGRRQLADLWRLKKKDEFLQSLHVEEPAEALAGEETSPGADELQPALAPAAAPPSAGAPDFEASDDPTQPGYYLQNIPFEAEQQEACHELIREAMFQAGVIYQEQMESPRMALKTFADLQQRYPDDELHLPPSYYLSYLMLMQQAREPEANLQRDSLLAKFPDSQEAEYLSDAEYLIKQKAMYRSQDSLFQATYGYFVQGKSDSLLMNCQLVETDYHQSPLRPNFLFMRALEAVKQGDGDTYISLISEIAEKYPNTDLSALSSAMKGYWDEGRRPIGFDGFYLPDGRSWEDSIAQLKLDSIADMFQYNPGEPQMLALAYSSDSIDVNLLLFDVALYNFTNFLIRDYELGIEMLGGQEVLMIRSFENMDDVRRYISWLNFQGQRPTQKYPGLRLYPVGESNLPLLQQNFPEEAYRQFLNDNGVDYFLK